MAGDEDWIEDMDDPSAVRLISIDEDEGPTELGAFAKEGERKRGGFHNLDSPYTNGFNVLSPSLGNFSPLTPPLFQPFSATQDGPRPVLSHFGSSGSDYYGLEELALKDELLESDSLLRCVDDSLLGVGGDDYIGVSLMCIFALGKTRLNSIVRCNRSHIKRIHIHPAV